MSIYTYIKEREFGRSCRRCINDVNALSLKTEDCVYLPYPAVCAHCAQMQNIVIDVRRGTRLLMKFRKIGRNK